MNYVRFNSEFGGSAYLATDIYKIELVEPMDSDSSFATLRIWYSDPRENPDDYETLSEAFIEEACTVGLYPDRERFEVKLAKSYDPDDVSSGESFRNIEYCRRHYPNGGTDFHISLIGEEESVIFRERGLGGTIEYNTIVEISTY